MTYPIEGTGDSAATEDAPPRRTATFNWRTLAPWAFPTLVGVLIVLLTGLGWSGTSIGVTQPNSPHLVAGTPRAIRSDEWNVATPLIVAQSHHDYRQESKDSIGTHKMGVLLDVPTKTWPTLFRPWDYGFFVLGVTRGFAFRWWALSGVLLLGGYGLLLQLTRRVLIAAIFAVAIWASPFFHWWYLDLSLATAGMGMAALAAFLAALERPVGIPRWCLLAISAWALIGFALVLYPPFQVPIAIVLIFVGLGAAWGRFGSGRHLLASVGPALAAVLSVSLVVLAAYYLDNRTAIRLINGTVYPGRRRNVGGISNLYQFFSAPFGYQLSVRGSGLTISNQSEISSFIPVAPYVVVQLLRVRFSGLVKRARAPLAGALAALVLLSTWYFVGLPGPLALITGLDRVQPGRAIGGIGLAGLLFAALFSAGLRHPVPEPHRRTGLRPLAGYSATVVSGALIAGAVAFGVTYASGRLLDQAAPSLGIGPHVDLAVSAVMAVVVSLLAAGSTAVGGALLAALGVVVSLSANPLYAGLSPYTSTALTGTFTTVAGSAGSGWMSLAGSPVSDVLIASGLRTVNSVSFYPDPSAWKILDPTGAHRDIWDRYANLNFAAVPGLSPPRMDLAAPDRIDISLDPCGRTVRQLDVGFVVADTPLSETCLVPVRTAAILGNQIVVYRITGSPTTPPGTSQA